MDTMRIPREFFEQFSVEQRMEMLRDPDMLKNAYLVFGNTETKLDTPKPASDYVEIPDWLEGEIMAMPQEYLADIVINLGWALMTERWDTPSKVTDGFTQKADDWLTAQSRETFKALLQWVAMELI
jgi:hypothetical protein